MRGAWCSAQPTAPLHSAAMARLCPFPRMSRWVQPSGPARRSRSFH